MVERARSLDETKAAPRKGRSNLASSIEKKSFASWKFDVEQAMLFDERLNASAFRIGVYVLSCVNAEIKVAFVSDETISLLVPGCRSRTTIYRARKLFKETKWMYVQEGRSGRATVYRFNDGNINPVFDVVAGKRDWRDAQRQKRRLKGQQLNVHQCER